MNTEKCPMCKERLYEWSLPHRCKPTWECIIKDYNDEDEPVNYHSNGHDAEEVAAQFAAEYTDEGNEWEVWVRKDSSEEWEKFNVAVEMVPSYTATAIAVMP